MNIVNYALQTTYQFFVPGKPQPAGSKNANPVFTRARGYIRDPKTGRPVVNVTDSNPKARKWKIRCGRVARDTIGQVPKLTGALELECIFILRRPPSHLKKSGGLRKGFSDFHIVKPDATKLLRAVEDGLTGVVWVDDAQIVRQIVSKCYGDVQGVHVIIREITTLASEPKLFE